MKGWAALRFAQVDRTVSMRSRLSIAAPKLRIGSRMKE